jgi:putative tricarboxylic transport membrane protein
MTDLLGAIGYLFLPRPFLYLSVGTALGIVVGAIPGLTGAMLIALTLPLTYYMVPVNAVILLVSMYTGSISGGLVSATLLRMPGTPANVMTTFDGYPMAKSGRPGRALGLGIGASFFGGMFAWVVLVILTKPLSDWATRFGPFEYFTLVLMALVLIASASQGTMVKGLLSAALGMLTAAPGVDLSTGLTRYTFGYWQLEGGLDVLPVLVGLFAVSTIISDLIALDEKVERLEYSSKGILMGLRDYWTQRVNLVRSAIIGTWVGILPGIGANVGSVVAYTVAKNMSRTPERFGKGAEEGIVASETANNATVGGALIPLIALGIPGSVIDVFLIGALMIHSIQPGPLLFIRNADVVWAMMATCLVSTIAMYLMMLGSCRYLYRLTQVPKSRLLPVIMVFCVIGVFASNSRFFEVAVMLFFGVLGFAMERAGIPLAPFVIGFILEPIAEAKLRAGLMMTAGSIWPMFTRPLPALFTAVSAVLLLWPFYVEWRRRARRL